MGQLKLFGRKHAYDETLTFALKRQHEPQRFVGDLVGGDFITQQRNAVPVGGPGTGNTHLDIATARS